MRIVTKRFSNNGEEVYSSIANVDIIASLKKSFELEVFEDGKDIIIAIKGLKP